MDANDFVERLLVHRGVEFMILTKRTEEICYAIHDVDDSQGV